MKQFNIVTSSTNKANGLNIEVTAVNENDTPFVRVWKGNSFFISFHYFVCSFKQLDENANGEMTRLKRSILSMSKTKK